jgi:hypothetical protein
MRLRLESRLAVTVTALALMVLGPAAQALPSPWAWWPFDDDADPTAELIHGATGDLASNIGAAGPTFTVGTSALPGIDCNRAALYFDGADDYVAIVDPGGSADLDGFSAVTLSAWVKPDGTAGGAVISKYDTHNAWLSYYLGLNPGDLRVRMLIGGAGGQNSSNEVYIGADGATLTPGVWSHIVGVWVGGTGPSSIRLYVDGVASATAYFANREFTGMYQGAVPVEIGAVHSVSGRQVGRSSFYRGHIDDPRIYTTALDPADVAELAAGGAALDACDACPIACQPQTERVFFGVVRRGSDGTLGSIQCWSVGSAVECRRDASGALLIGPPECAP